MELYLEALWFPDRVPVFAKGSQLPLGRSTFSIITKELVRVYETLSANTQRMMVRIKAIYRAHGIGTPGSGVYQQKQREQWLQLLTESRTRQRVNWLYEELDLRSLRKQAKMAMVAEGRKHQAFRLLRTIPQLGPVRCAMLVATIDRPYRFRTKHPLWAYSGLAIVIYMSSEYEIKDNRVVRSRKPLATRGLNRNYDRRLKQLFISVAVAGSRSEPYAATLGVSSSGGYGPKWRG
jgi:transposase